MGEAAPTPARARLGLLAIGLAILAPAMDTSVNIAMPAITAAFALGPRDIQWVVTCYMLANGALMLTCGRLGDLYGHRLILRSGLCVCAVAFALSALASSYPALLAGRALQGVGIALLLSCGPALATALYSEGARTRVLGIYGAIFALGGALGPLIGSWLVAALGWMGVFAMRAPLVLLALALTMALPAKPASASPSPVSGPAFDWAGAVLLVFWMGCLMLAAAGPHDLRALWPDVPDWLPTGTGLSLVLAGAGLLGVVLFAWHESRTRAPIIRLSVFRSGRFVALNLFTMLVNIASFSVLLIVPYFLVRGLKLPIEQAGLMLAISGLGNMAGAFTIGRLGARIAPLRLAPASVALIGACLIGIGQWQANSPLWVIALPLFCQGLGLGLYQVAYNDSVLGTLPIEDRGVAGGLTMMVRTLGILGGATGLSGLFASRLATNEAIHGAGAEPAFHAAFQQSLTLVGSALLAALLLTLLRPRVWR